MLNESSIATSPTDIEIEETEVTGDNLMNSIIEGSFPDEPEAKSLLTMAAGVAPLLSEKLNGISQSGIMSGWDGEVAKQVYEGMVVPFFAVSALAWCVYFGKKAFDDLLGPTLSTIVSLGVGIGVGAYIYNLGTDPHSTWAATVDFFNSAKGSVSHVIAATNR